MCALAVRVCSASISLPSSSCRAVCSGAAHTHTLPPQPPALLTLTPSPTTQREHVIALLQLSRRHTRRVTARRDALLAACAESAADVEAQEGLVADLARVNSSYSVFNTACLLAL